MYSILAAIGAFIVAFFLINLVLPAGWAALLAVVVAIGVFFGIPRTRL